MHGGIILVPMPEQTANRRTFAIHLARGAWASSLMATGAVSLGTAQEPSSNQPPPAAPTDLQLQLIQGEYPSRLEGEQLAEIQRELERQQARSRALRQFPLTNADEPGIRFAAWRADQPQEPG